MEVDDGHSVERGSAVAGFKGVVGRIFGPPGCCSVRGRHIDGDPVDRKSQGGRAGGPSARLVSGIDPRSARGLHRRNDQEQKDITLDEMVRRLDAKANFRIGRSALSVWLRGRNWTFKKRPHTHWSRSAPTS
jgi:hypothetical protein